MSLQNGAYRYEAYKATGLTGRIFFAAVNVRGVVIRSVSSADGSHNSNSCKATIFESDTSPEERIFYVNLIEGEATPLPVFIPAGVGLHWRALYAQHINITYDIL